MNAMKGRVRVLIVAPSLGSYGGMEAFVLWLVEALARDRRIDARACFKRMRGFKLEGALTAAAKDLPVEFVRKASREIWSAISWADVVHAQHASPDVAFIAAAQRKPIALSIHNVLPAQPWLRRLSWKVSTVLAAARWYNSRFVWDSWEPHGYRYRSACVFPSSPSLNASIARNE